jgi:AcrR family transcriptional regulator
MPRLIDGASRAEALAVAVNELLVTDGIPGLTLRRIGAVSGVSPGSMIHHLGGKDRVLALSAGLTARAFHEDIQRRSWDDGILAFLPDDDDGVLGTRAWLAWVELGRSHPVVEIPVTQARRDERGLLARTLDFRSARDELDELFAVIGGLRDAICAASRPMSPTKARELLARHLERLGLPVRPDAGER